MKGTFAVLLLVLVIFPAVLTAQEFTGHVEDSTGATVAKAQITVHNLQTGVNIKTVTTRSGDYTVPYLKPGTYAVSAEAPGFKIENRTNIDLQVGQTAVINFTMEVGSVTQTVTVAAPVALLDAGKADRGEVVENTRVTQLPLNGGDPGMLAILSPGVFWTGSLQYQRPFDDTLNHLQVNGGGGGNSNEFMLDGVNNEAGSTGVAYVPPIDAVQDFRIVTNPYDAQYGDIGGGVVDMTLKSGTNNLHGNLYEYARRTWLDANYWQNNWLAAQSPANASEYARPQMKWDQYGAELDGPVMLPKIYDGRDKSFFLLQYEKFWEIQPKPKVTSVPDPNWINGDFSNDVYWDGNYGYQPVIIYDPLTLHRTSSGAYVRDPFPGNKIPQSRISPVAQKLMSYYPKPNLIPAPGTNPFANNYAMPTPQDERYRNVLGKWDWNITPLDHFSLRYGYWERVETVNETGIPGIATEGHMPYGERAHSFTTEWTHTFTPNLLFDFRAAATIRANYAFYGPDNFDETSLGWPTSEVSQFPNNDHVFPHFEPSGYAYLGSNGASENVSNTLSLFPSVTWNKGKHTLHGGVDIRFMQYATPLVTGGPELGVGKMWTQASYIASIYNNASGNPFASILLGTAQSGSVSINSSLEFESWHYFAGYLQDDWKFTPKLTLNLGVRYDVDRPTVERHNEGNYIFDTSVVNPVDSQINHAYMPSGEQATGGITFLGIDGNPRTPWAVNWTDIQPRVGFAYSARRGLVIRGGIGEIYQPPITGIDKTGYTHSTGYISSLDGDKTPNPTANIIDPFPTVVQPIGTSLGMLTNLGTSISFINPHYRVPSYWTYSFGIEQRFGAHDILNISYVGSRTHNGTYSQNINDETENYYVQCNIEMGGDPDYCLNDYPKNPFYHVAAFNGTTYYKAPTIQGGNLTRPFPEFTTITEDDLNGAHTWYNSLQVTGLHKWNNALTLHGTWTWSKSMDAGGWTDQIYQIQSRHIDGNDRTHRVTLSGVYMLPVGRGRTFLGSANRLVNSAIGGWELTSIFVYETGHPWPVPGSPNERYVHNAWVPRHVEQSTGYIRGVAACVSEWEPPDNQHSSWYLAPFPYNYDSTCNQTDFIAQPSYGVLTNTVYTGIRVPSDYQFDTNLAKNFGITKRLNLQFRLEAFNVLNHPLWQENYEGMAENPDFGTIERGPWGQSNVPREMQLAFKLNW